MIRRVSFIEDLRLGIVYKKLKGGMCLSSPILSIKKINRGQSPASSKLKVGFQGRLSRILSRPKRTSAFIYLSDREIAARSPRKRSATHPGPMGGPPGPLFGLAPDWVYHAPLVALRAVSSYPTFSPLPCSFYPTGRFIFCDTIRHSQFEPKTPSLSRGILPFDVRTFLSNCKNQSECILPENRN